MSDMIVFEITNSLISQFLMLSRNLCVDTRGTQVAVKILLMNQRKKEKKEEKYKIRKIIFYTHTACTLAQEIVRTQKTQKCIRLSS